MTEQLFNVDDFLQTKNAFEIAVGNRKVPTTRVAWHVIEVNTQTCSAGTQYWYTCRPHIPEMHKYDRSFRDWTGNELLKFNQIELERFEDLQDDVEEPIDPTTAGVLLKQITDMIVKGKPKDAK